MHSDTQDTVTISTTQEDAHVKVSLTVGKQNVDLSADTVESVVGSLQDSEENQNLFAVLAEHPASGVRGQVAYKDNLSADTVMLLAKDPSPEVRRSVLRSSAGRSHLTEDVLRVLATTDVECAETIAGNVDGYNIDSESLAEMLAEHSDPRVRRAAAGCSGMPKRLLKKLVKDADASVRRDAKYTLE
jgi:hypothetical protein